MAEAFRIAKGFLPVNELPLPLLTKLLLPLVLVELEIPFVFKAGGLTSGTMASALKDSILYRISLIFSLGTF